MHESYIYNRLILYRIHDSEHTEKQKCMSLKAVCCSDRGANVLLKGSTVGCNSHPAVIIEFLAREKKEIMALSGVAVIMYQ